jgi:hypothetical protein
MRILLALPHYGETGEGDVKRLTDREGLYRLRVEKWRVFSTLTHGTQFEFTASTTAGRRTSQLSQISVVDNRYYHKLEIPSSGTTVR